MLYLKMIRNAFRTNAAYRTDVLPRLLSRVIELSVMIAIWHALFLNRAETETSVGAVTLDEMIAYAILSAGISIFINNNAIGKIDSKIKTGDIATDLIRPFSFKGSLLSDTAGDNLFRFVIEFIPLLLIGVFFFDFPFTTWPQLLLFVVALVNGVLLNFLVNYILGLICFWYMSVWNLKSLSGYMISLFSGSLIPLWFFPQVLVQIGLFLPFRLIYYAPICLYLGKFTWTESLSAILTQFAWIAGLLVVERVLWNRGKRKLVIQGG